MVEGGLLGKGGFLDRGLSIRGRGEICACAFFICRRGEVLLLLLERGPRTGRVWAWKINRINHTGRDEVYEWGYFLLLLLLFHVPPPPAGPLSTSKSYFALRMSSK